MPKLVLVEGCTGSGKSSVTEYLESRGYDRHSFDDYVGSSASSAGWKFDDAIRLASYHGTWDCSTNIRDIVELL